MKRIPLFIALVLPLLCAIGRPCAAMSVVAPPFGKLVHISEQIVRAKAVASNSRWDTTVQGGRVIHTYIQFQVLRTIKGDPQDTVTLRFLGGQVGPDGMVIPDMPTFDIGGTYILFIAQNGRAFCPLVGVGHGSYRAVVDGASGTEHVVRADGAPLRSVADVNQPLEPSDWVQTSVASGLRTEDFENAILKELGNSGNP